MNIIISPAKKMNECHDDLLSSSSSPFIENTMKLFDIIKDMNYDDLKKLLDCNDEIAELNYNRFKNMDLSRNLTPAVLAYDGIQYKYMSPNTFSQNELDYIQKHLKILSGFYGILRPFDGVVPYRLEMQAKLKTDNFKNLYDFWGNKLYSDLKSESNIILNLASKEYSKCIEKYLSKDDVFITCIFGTLKDGKVKVKATEAKMARGSMTRFLAQNNITDIEGIKAFSDLGFSYSEIHSNDKEFVFIK